MKEKLIEFETAKLAKEKGFDIEYFNFYVKPNCKMFGVDEKYRYYPIANSKKDKVYTIGKEATLNPENVLTAPTQSLLQRWLREVHNKHIVIQKNDEGWYFSSTEVGGSMFNSFEEALENALFYNILIIIKKETV